MKSMEKLEKTNTTADKLSMWQERYTDATSKYSTELETIEDDRKAYDGTRKIKGPNGKDAAKQTSTTRKVCFELVETQADTNIPLPKVISRDGYEEQATTIEMFLKNEVERLPMIEINDQQSRNAPTDGAALFFVEWDNTKGTRKTSGELVVKNLDSTQVTPQPGVFDIEMMDYIFVEFEQTRLMIEQKYGVIIENEEGNTTINADLLKHIFAFYRDNEGNIGLFSYVGDTIVQDYPKYYSRRMKVCTKCGELKDPLKEECVCGSTDFKLEVKEMEKITIFVETPDPLTGQVTQEPKEIEIPYYVPKFFPIVLRKNVSRLNKFLGSSDISYIKDQQNDLSIYSAKIKEKMLKGGSVLIKPKNLSFKANDEELKILEIENPQQFSMIDIKNLQPDISKDTNMLEMTYTIARQTIGITDSFQGRQDTTATSGKAKEIAAAQAAGRLASKKKMKDAAFGKLYEYLFKLLLGFADEPRSYTALDNKGEMIYKIFDKRDFILQDANGDYYYNDDFICATDVSSTLSNNREAMWQETRLNFTSGAYGNPVDLGTLSMFWNMMQMLHYPGAQQALKNLEQRKMEAELIRQQEMLAKNIAETNMESVMTKGKMKELEQGNQIQQLKQQASTSNESQTGDL